MKTFYKLIINLKIWKTKYNRYLIYLNLKEIINPDKLKSTNNNVIMNQYYTLNKMN